ncbi:MAG: lipid IV(A) palmitoyltransferase PagP [Thiomonas sp.]
MNTGRSRLLPLILLAWLALAPRMSWALGLGGVSDWAQTTWNAAVDTTHTGQDDLYFSGYTWHDPRTYTAAKRATLNSHAWGIGWGRHRFNADGNEDMVYAMIFSDSHRNAEPVVGYAHQWMFNNDAPVGFGLGYTLALTSRADIFKNIPFPIVLPIASIRFGNLSIYGTFIPKVNNKLNNGNVAFFFGRYAF